jgi:predicted O-linked N-acetylglucosamine transferase (SPINDLY family)
MARPLRLRDPAREVGQTAFLLPYQGRNDRELMTRLAAMYERACPELPYVAPHCRARRPPGHRIRVGFASKFFHSHSVGIWYNQLIALLAALPDFEVVLVDLGGQADPELRAACARTLVPPRELAQAREAIAAAALDVLVYADIGMDPFGYFLAYSRLAPVQCATFGHPVTSGLPSIDYFISSRLFEPEDAQDHYRERLVRLDALPLYIPRPAPPARPKGRSELGLPLDKHLYACPMMLHKFHPDFDAAMAAILRRDPKAEILLFRDGRFPRRHEALLRRFRSAHADVADRLRFLPWASPDDLLSIILASDVIIDTFHFSAGTTAFLVFALGTPMVTLPGAYARGRPTYGCYLKMGLMDCVARDPDDFVDIAVRIATTPELRGSLRERILRSCGTLYADPASVTALAEFLRSAARAAPGEPPPPRQ